MLHKILRKIVLVLGLVPILGYGAIVRVPSGQPTINLGIGAAGVGDTVYVAPGNYPENVNINKAIKLLAREGAGRVYVKPVNNTMLTCSGANVRVFGIRFDGQGYGGASATGINITGASFVAHACTLKYAYNTYALISSLSIRMVDCLIDSCRSNTDFTRAPYTSGRVNMYNTTIKDCYCPADFWHVRGTGSVDTLQNTTWERDTCGAGAGREMLIEDAKTGAGEYINQIMIIDCIGNSGFLLQTDAPSVVKIYNMYATNSRLTGAIPWFWHIWYGTARTIARNGEIRNSNISWGIDAKINSGSVLSGYNTYNNIGARIALVDTIYDVCSTGDSLRIGPAAGYYTILWHCTAKKNRSTSMFPSGNGTYFNCVMDSCPNTAAPSGTWGYMCWQACPGVVDNLNNNLANTDPKLTKKVNTNGDTVYYGLDSSPCINAGNNAYPVMSPYNYFQQFTTDIGNSDMGCHYEYQVISAGPSTILRPWAYDWNWKILQRMGW